MSQKTQTHWTAIVACLGPVGYLPKAPGTWGTLVALPFAAALLINLGLWGTLFVTMALICFSVWCCGAAEKALQLRDPGCVVLDEFVAVPVCYLGSVMVFPQISHQLLSSQNLFSAKTLSFHLAVFILFRIFDILKPWPVGPSQKWPRGWGVVMDDVLAAGYVNLVLMAGLFVF